MEVQVAKRLLITYVCVSLSFSSSAVKNAKIYQWKGHWGNDVQFDIDSEKQNLQRDDGMRVGSKSVLLRQPRDYRKRFEEALDGLEKWNENGRLLQSDLEQKKTALKTDVDRFKSDIDDLQSLPGNEPLVENDMEQTKTSLQTDFQLFERDIEEIKQAMESQMSDTEKIDDAHSSPILEDTRKKKTKGKKKKKKKRERKGKNEEEKEGGQGGEGKSTAPTYGETLNARMACTINKRCKEMKIRGRKYNFCKYVHYCSNIG